MLAYLNFVKHWTLDYFGLFIHFMVCYSMDSFPYDVMTLIAYARFSKQIEQRA